MDSKHKITVSCIQPTIYNNVFKKKNYMKLDGHIFRSNCNPFHFRDNQNVIYFRLKICDSLVKILKARLR